MGCEVLFIFCQLQSSGRNIKVNNARARATTSVNRMWPNKRGEDPLMILLFGAWWKLGFPRSHSCYCLDYESHHSTFSPQTSFDCPFEFRNWRRKRHGADKGSAVFSIFSPKFSAMNPGKRSWPWLEDFCCLPSFLSSRIATMSMPCGHGRCRTSSWKLKMMTAAWAHVALEIKHAIRVNSRWLCKMPKLSDTDLISSPKLPATMDHLAAAAWWASCHAWMRKTPSTIPISWYLWSHESWHSCMETDCRFASLQMVKDDVYAGGATDFSWRWAWMLWVPG